jgi:SsrA-binding protein
MSGGKGKGGTSDGGIRVIAENRKARAMYSVDEKVEAGLELTGSEVKALRAGTANLSDAYALPSKGQLFLLNAHIGAYNPSSFFAHDPLRGRRLLMHRTEIDRWTVKVRETGLFHHPPGTVFQEGAGEGGAGAVPRQDARGQTAGHQGTGDEAGDGPGDTPSLRRLPVLLLTCRWTRRVPRRRRGCCPRWTEAW